MVFIEIGWASLDWLIWLSVRSIWTGLCERCREPSGTIRYGELRDCLRNFKLMKAYAPRSYFCTLKELRLYFFLHHSSKHRWHEPVLSWCRVFCVILRQAQTYILQNDVVYFVRVWIFIMTRKFAGHYTAISCKSRSTSSFCVVA